MIRYRVTATFQGTKPVPEDVEIPVSQSEGFYLTEFHWDSRNVKLVSVHFIVRADELFCYHCS